MSTPHEKKPTPPAEAKKKRRRRRRRRPSEASGAAAELLAQKNAKIDTEKDADAPLSEEEVEALRRYFRFLQANRKILRLRVNAAEDLLLNGVREPTHRGVCQHLLAKVERSAVISAVEKLEPAAAAKLLGGIIGFSPEIEYVLLFLERVQRSASQAEATAALSQALRQIDFSKVSDAQMRRVLGLLAELFGEQERPQLLLGLLESRSFRTAFDSSMPQLPESLAQLVIPLRAAQSAILHGKKDHFEPDVLSQGILYLLDADDRTLLRHPPEVRQRLFSAGVQVCANNDHSLHRGLKTLLRSFEDSKRRHSELGMALARHFLAAQEDKEARKLLKALSDAHPDFRLPARWLEILDAPRIDRFALSKRSKPTQDASGQHRRTPAVWLDTMRAIWLQVGSDDGVETHLATAQLLNELCIPGVAPLLHSGTTEEGAPYFTQPDPGQELGQALTHKGGLSLEEAMRMCREATGILAALASAGVVLPDAHSRRFALDEGRRLWLMDVSGGQQGSAEAAHLELARGLCQFVLNRARRYIPPQEAVQALERSKSFAQLARALEPWA